MLTPAYLEAFETLKLRFISAPCVILLEVTSNAMLTVATDTSTMWQSFCKTMEESFNKSITVRVSLI
jgi:hypothetical protein